MSSASATNRSRAIFQASSAGGVCDPARKINACRHLDNGIDIFQNIPQANEVRPLDHSKHPNRLSLNFSPQQRMESFTGGEIGMPAKDVSQPLAQPHQFDEAEALGIIVNEQIDIAL
jgi:hypothetical protein